MLTFVEEILLLTLDDENGSFMPIRDNTMEYVLAGAVLMDLAFTNRIDTDPDQLILLNKAATGIAMIDPVLGRIADTDGSHDTRYWVESIAREFANALRKDALNSLIGHGILESKEQKLLWVFRARRYPVIDGRAEREVKLRIAGVLFSDEIPDPRDVSIICLADACGILRHVFGDREVERIRPRIEQVRKLDLIGREVSETIMEIERTMAMAMARIPH